jgi:glucose/arabinose dehydrogenase
MVFPTARRRRGRATAGARRCPEALLVLLLLLAPPDARGAIYSDARFSDTPIVTGLNQPTDFAFLPDGRILILEKPGRVLIAGPGGGAPAVALDITANVDQFSERGLLGICLHPSFASTGWIYFYYTRNSPARNRISRFTLAGNTISAGSETFILDNIDATNGNHNGGTVAIGPDGKLWAAPGDSGTGGAKAQDLTSLSGKVLRMELDGSPAAGNPAFAQPRIWAYGFRNPFRFGFRPSNGKIYIGDVGQSTREELDVGVAGGNFGWPYMEGGIQQPGGPGPCPATTTCIPPVFDYGRTVGTTITGGVFVTGNAYPPFLQGRYVFGDYGGGQGWIKYLEFDSNDAVVGGLGGLHDLATSAGGPVAFHVGPDGYLYYAAIGVGRIYRIDFGKGFNMVTPCRVLDTRDPAGPYGGPRLGAGSDRTFTIGLQCGVPAGARAVSANVTVTGATDSGHLVILPAGGALTNTSSINFRAGQTRANNAILTLGQSGAILVRTGMAAGGVHMILDVTGYFD